MPGSCLVALLCTLSTASICFFLYGDHIHERLVVCSRWSQPMATMPMAKIASSARIVTKSSAISLRVAGQPKPQLLYKPLI